MEDMGIVSDAEMAAQEWVEKNAPELDPVCGDDGYPTEIELGRIGTWQDQRDSKFEHVRQTTLELIAYIKARWWAPDWGWREIVDRDGAIHYEISTGGWSGNESLMGALEKNWLLYYHGLYQGERRGGHYIWTLEPVLFGQTDG